MVNNTSTLLGYRDLKKVSGNYQGHEKRVDLARCYANNPDVLFMDEPFGALDAMTKEKMQIDLLNLWIKEQKPYVSSLMILKKLFIYQKNCHIFSSTRKNKKNS